MQVRVGKYPVSDAAEAMQKGDTATTVIDKNGNNAGEIFRFNPGKDKQIFPPKHPYRMAQDNVKKIVESLQAQVGNSDYSENRKRVLSWAKANLVGKSISNDLKPIGQDI